VINYLFFSSQLNFFRYLLQSRSYKRKSVEVGVFQRGDWVSLSANFRRKRGRTPGLLTILCKSIGNPVEHEPLLVLDN